MAAAATAPEPNLVLAGRYRLEKRLGAGGMGAIWRAEHLVLRAPVAVKLLEREALPDEDTIARFMREAQAAATLRSPHVVQIFDYGVDGRWPFIVMELLEGENLAQRIKRVKRLSPETTLRILTHIARAMVRAHEAGIVHRDLKPENVFLIKNEDEEVAKVLDFGVAKVSSTALGQPGQESARTRTGSILGTPYYMSPEQAQGNKTVDHRSDLWSLAVIAFECLTGSRPFFSDGLGDLVLAICVRDIPIPSERASVPLGFDAWFAKAVARDPDLRFQTPRALIESLRDALGIESERTGSNPDILISSSSDARDTQQSSEPPPSERPPNSAVATINQNGSGMPAESERGSSFQVVSSRSSQNVPDVNAATVVALASEKDDFAVPSLKEALFGAGGKKSSPPRRTALGGVIGVAIGALAVGLVVGLVAL
ncbi:MAG TPA: serine/threonine-protein kinase, partial [Polyangiaceae bacterium]|nr:serine/threonine-protein kinase [Polyangiaceae bacterium]